MAGTQLVAAGSAAPEAVDRLARPTDAGLAAVAAWWRASHCPTHGQIYLMANPLLHLNGAEIAGPTLLARKDPEEVRSLLSGHGYEVIEVEGDDVPGIHLRFADALAWARASIRRWRPRPAAAVDQPRREAADECESAPAAIHQLVHGRPEPDRLHVRGFIEEGTTTTPFDMVVRNRASRHHLVIDALNAAKRTPPGPSEVRDGCEQQLSRHERDVVDHLQDIPELRDWSPGDWAEGA